MTRVTGKGLRKPVPFFTVMVSSANETIAITPTITHLASLPLGYCRTDDSGRRH